ncbi:unnamed protein product [Amoebophrya sp. A25]|nr:unnamed protein product [Amoebophrya sp. A25]|eukprot:GSA25T00007494001.1
MTKIPVISLRWPCSACCCTISSLYCTFPQCLGCTCSGTALFLQGRCSACKPLDCKDQNKRCCAVVESQEYCVIPTRCIDNQVQCCCVDSRSALPCTNTTPCLVNTMGLTLCADFGCKVACCASIGTLIPRLKQ